MHCGFVVLVGRPSVGKSTFANAVCQEEISSTAPSPQTTQTIVKGIYTDPKRGQLIFLDTPGFFPRKQIFASAILRRFEMALRAADVVLYLLDSTRPFGEQEDYLCRRLEGSSKAVLVGINKVDIQNNLEILQKQLRSYQLPQAHLFSARTKEGLNEVVQALFALVPPCSELPYPPTIHTDQSLEFRLTETIREQILTVTQKELTHEFYVAIDQFKEISGNRLKIYASIFVNSPSQKPILIGKQGSIVKKIRLATQSKINSVFKKNSYLDLRIKVHKNWTKDPVFVERLLSRT